MKHQPFRLGLTGSIGMGKSTTARMFVDEGLPVWDADAAVHRLYAPGGAAVAPMGALRADATGAGGVNRTALKAWISEDPDALRQIEALVHPLVAEDRHAFLSGVDADIVVFDIPLLFETGGEEAMDAVAVVSVPADVQRDRVLSRPGMTEALFEIILVKQTPDAEKCRRADYVIETLTLEAAQRRVREVIADIRRSLTMREIVLDTETTGLDPQTGDRIVEIGAVELLNHVPTGRTYHQYINPERDMPQEAYEVHGLDIAFLSDKPRFAEVAQGFLDFATGAKLVIHNAAFDIKFLNAELGWCQKPTLSWDGVVDTLAIARKRFPGSPASLDALCRRFGIDNSARTLHGALLDSEILAEVYLELIGGRQPGFSLDRNANAHRDGGDQAAWRPRPRPEALPTRTTDEERRAHDAMVETLGENALWSKLT